MKSISAKFLIGIFLFIFAGYLGYKLFPSPNSFDQATSSKTSEPIRTQVEPPVKALPQKEITEVPERPIETEKTEVKEDVPPPAPEPLRYLSLLTQDGTGDIQACIEFDAKFDEIKESDIKPFIRISPKTPFSVDAKGTQLCLLGLNYGQSYDVEILKGLTADNGAELARKQTLALSFEDKPAFVGLLRA